ncbi:hypothetical protein [Pleionea sediminis]|uniref:hypothetical protein n=1 Tax=Pleionea sediminis TaxID=2569479 RepID=UPI0011857E65|nr:hypothetical protein [Pleionea sediminis]
MLKANKPLITYQTGENESYLIGTKEQLIEFANSIIDSVKSAKPEEFFGMKVLVSNDIHGSLDSKAEIQLDAVIVTESDEQKDAIFYNIYNS